MFFQTHRARQRDPGKSSGAEPGKKKKPLSVRRKELPLTPQTPPIPWAFEFADPRWMQDLACGINTL